MKGPKARTIPAQGKALGNDLSKFTERWKRDPYPSKQSDTSIETTLKGETNSHQVSR